MRKVDFQIGALALYEERLKYGPPLTELEKTLWSSARSAQYGGTIIGGPGDPYLLRAYLLPERLGSTAVPGLFLHYFVRGDDDANPHNHPGVSTTPPKNQDPT